MSLWTFPARPSERRALPTFVSDASRTLQALGGAMATPTIDLGPIWGYCPDWCIEESDPRAGLRVPNSEHGTQHAGPSTWPGANSHTVTGGIYVAVQSMNIHGMERTAVADEDRDPWVEIVVHDGAPVMAVTPAVARSLAAHLLHHADIADGLR